MKILAFSVLSVLFMLWQSIHSQTKPAIIPQSVDLQWQKGTYAMSKENTICYSSEIEASAKRLEQLLKSTTSETKLVKGEQCGNFTIGFDKNRAETLGDQGY